MFAYILHAVCTEGACKSVLLHNIGSMCVTSLPTQISMNVPPLKITSRIGHVKLYDTGHIPIHIPVSKKFEMISNVFHSI